MKRLLPLRPVWLLVLGLACAVYAPPTAAADAQPVAADPQLEARVQALAKELRCLVCQNQTIADSSAPLALDLKDQVREQLRAGRSESQIIAFMSERYGDFVLYRPPLSAATLALWLGPLGLLLLGAYVLARTLRQRAAQGGAPPLSAAQQAQAAKLLDQADGKS